MTRTISISLRWLLLLAVSVTLVGSVVSALEGQAAQRLYEAKDTAVARYLGGLERIRHGEASSGRAEINRAVSDLGTAGDACAATPGCETQRFMTAYHNLLTLRSAVLAGAAEDFVELEMPLDDEALAVYPEPGDDRLIGGSIGQINGRDLADLIEHNSLVRAALHDWLTWMRPTLIDTYENYMHMRHLMWPAYEEAGLPEGLLFGILAKESGGRVHSVSRAGASGPLQFMHHTGLRFGLTSDNGFDQRFDPSAATRANVAYLRERFAQLDGNLELALAAYNGGETRILRLARASAEPSFWNPEIFRQLPRETQEYVPYVLAAALLFLRPEDYGLEFPRIEPAPGSIELQAPITLSELAICVGQADSRAGWFRTLRNLNPREEHDVHLPAGTKVQLPAPLAARYRENCLEGPLLQLARSLHDSRDERRAWLAIRTYTVRNGDTISTIAAEQGCPSSRSIAETNGIEGPRYLIRPGQQLKLTGCRS
jgi:membrane-bound lytic murein transglycosylase D